MKEIVVISGKGGTGKTSITASFAVLEKEKLIVADCDVDAADMHLLLEPDFGKSEAFYSGEVASIDPELCTGCNECVNVCRFDAIAVNDGIYEVQNVSCEGCGYCARVCPVNAITNSPEHVGEFYLSKIKTGTSMMHARLNIGADNSGKLVAKVKNEAKELAAGENKDFVLVDGSPGVGCPVVSSLSGASFVVLVTEPSVSGFHDLKRVYELVKKFRIPAGCIVNKADINQDILRKIENFLEEEGIFYLAQVPYNEEFTAAMTQGRTIVEWDPAMGDIVKTAWEKVKEITVQ